MKPRSAKAKGTRLEVWVTKQLESLGLKARRQPGSGIYSTFPHDVYCEFPDGPAIVETKSWRHGWRTGDSALGAADILIIKRDFGEPCAYIHWRMFARLIAMATAAQEELRRAEEAARNVA